jgi:hypothetical protein
MANETTLVYPDGEDSLPVEWDKAEYEADPDGVIAQIKAGRAAVAMTEDQYEPMPDYNAQVGKDS